MLEQFLSLGWSLELVFGVISRHFCMFLVDLWAFLEKPFCFLRRQGRVCYSPYLFQSMILSFPFIAFSLHLLLLASASSAPFPRGTSTCNWQSELDPFCFSFIDDSWLESRSVDRFINRSFSRSYGRSFDRYKHVDGIVTLLCSMSCAMENQARAKRARRF